MKALLDLQLACDEQASSLPTETDIQHWLDTALAEFTGEDSEITVRIVNSTESQQLNSQYRNKDYPTNVLSFPFQAPTGITIPLLGDLVICAKVVADEAAQQNKPLLHHWAHMVIHGLLHLLGYDHIEEAQAEAMESLEIAILAKLAIDDPYQDH